MVFDSISCNIDEFLLINSSTNLFAFGDFNIHHKDWLAYSSGTDRTVELCYQIMLLSWLTFLLISLTVTLKIKLFWIYFFLVMLVFVLQWLFLHWEISSCCCLGFHWFSNKLKTGCPVSLRSLWLFLCWLWQCLSPSGRCSIGEYC